MPSRFSIFSHSCKPLAEIQADTTPRSWVTNDYGQADFTLSTSDAKCTENNLQYGNLVFIEHIPSEDAAGTKRGRLRDWVGFIFVPREWTEGRLKNTAYSAEALLAYRPMPFVDVRGTPKQIFKQIIDFANRAGTVRFQLGVLEDTPLNLSDTLRLSAYDHIRTLCNNSGMSWNVTAQINSKNELVLFANLYRDLGTETSLILTSTNTEAGSPLLSEQGNIANVVIGYSQANTAQSRLVATATHQGSLDDYGYFGVNQIHMGARDAASVQAASQAIADARGRPRKTLQKIGVLDVSDTFAHLAPGNLVLRRETLAGFRPGGGLGFDAQARILSVDYNDTSRKATVNLEVLY